MARNRKQVLVAAIGWSPTYEQAPSSRALYLFSEIKKRFPETSIIMQDDGKGVKMDHLYLIRPIVAPNGHLRLLKGILYRFQASAYVLRFVRKNNVGMIILRGYDNAILAPFLKLLNVKIVYDFHGLESCEHIDEKRYLRSFFTKYFERTMLQLSDRILVISGGVKEQILWTANKCISLPNGINIKKVIDSSGNIENGVGGKKTIGFIGNWEYFMRMDDLCEAMKYLKDYEGIVIGWGKDAAEFTKKYEALTNLHFTGRLTPDNAYAMLKKCDIFVLPYSNEDIHSRIPDYYCTRKMREYIAIGRPIIVSDIAGKEKVLVNGYNCLYYNPGDPGDLANKALLLFNDQALYDRIRSNVEAMSSSISWESIIEHSGLLEEISSMLSI